MWNRCAGKAGPGAHNRQGSFSFDGRCDNLAHFRDCGRRESLVCRAAQAGSVFQKFSGRNGCGSHGLVIRHRSGAGACILLNVLFLVGVGRSRAASFRAPPIPFIVVTPARLLEDRRSLAAVIDHTLLKPEATSAQIERHCEEALSYGFATVCINPCWVTLARERLNNSTVKVCTVVGFPLGANDTAIKIQEAATAREQGALEIDMVINIGALRSGDHALVKNEIREIAKLVKTEGGLLKVIIESSLLNEQEKTAACRLSVRGGADFVKTSTGFSTGGATVEDVQLMRRTVGPDIGVKASGGIRTLAALKQMLVAGATRIGTSASVSIIDEFEGAAAEKPASGY